MQKYFLALLAFFVIMTHIKAQTDYIDKQFMGKSISLDKKEDVYVIPKRKNRDEMLAGSVEDIFKNLKKATRIEPLDVNFLASDEPVTDNFFVFLIKIETGVSLWGELYDEEGFRLTHNLIIRLKAGENYKALDLNNLQSGYYIFRIKDKEGRDLSREIRLIK